MRMILSLFSVVFRSWKKGLISLLTVGCIFDFFVVWFFVFVG